MDLIRTDASQSILRQRPFQGRDGMIYVVFPYEPHMTRGEVHIFDMIAPGQNWR
jgi:hypothetical protein